MQNECYAPEVRSRSTFFTTSVNNELDFDFLALMAIDTPSSQIPTRWAYWYHWRLGDRQGSNLANSPQMVPWHDLAKFTLQVYLDRTPSSGGTALRCCCTSVTAALP